MRLSTNSLLFLLFTFFLISCNADEVFKKRIYTEKEIVNNIINVQFYQDCITYYSSSLAVDVSKTGKDNIGPLWLNYVKNIDFNQEYFTPEYLASEVIGIFGSAINFYDAKRINSLKRHYKLAIDTFGIVYMLEGFDYNNYNLIIENYIGKINDSNTAKQLALEHFKWVELGSSYELAIDSKELLNKYTSYGKIDFVKMPKSIRTDSSYNVEFFIYNHSWKYFKKYNYTFMGDTISNISIDTLSNN